jgi:S1-C subfamily serine protease
MSLREVYRELRKSIVAFAPKYFLSTTENPEYPPILGTGFVIREDGLTATNWHVVNSFKKVLRPRDAPENEWPIYALIYVLTEEGLAEIRLDILRVFEQAKFVPQTVYYGPKEGPDLAYVQVKAKGLPPASIDSTTLIEEGAEVATAGFPMGENMLTAPGRLDRIGPILQRGIVSAVHPFVSSTPHRYSVNIMVQPGASGSPVFLTDAGEVIGVTSHSIFDIQMPCDDTHHWYRVPTNISYAVPSHYIQNFLSYLATQNRSRLPPDAESLEEILANWPSRDMLERGRDWIAEKVQIVPVTNQVRKDAETSG